MSEIGTEKQADSAINIYVLTTGNTERVQRIQSFLAGLTFEFVESDSMDELRALERKYKKKSHQFRQKAMMAGEIGAFSTHSKAWERIIESKKPGIIIEDNVEFLKAPSMLMSDEIISQIESCGLISFTDLCYKRFPDKPFIISSIPEKKPLPIICYGVTPERAYNLIESMRKTAYVMPVDKWLAIPKLCGCYGFVSHVRVARRAHGLASIANKKKGKKSINPINMIYWAKNKIKYRY